MKKTSCRWPKLLLTQAATRLAGVMRLSKPSESRFVRALRESNWVVGGARGAAARLGLKRTSLAYKMQKLGISRPPH